MVETTLFYKTKENKEEIINNLLKEQEILENSINRREKLLSNENYVNKAPQEVVAQDKIKLSEEKQKLSVIITQLSEYNN